MSEGERADIAQGFPQNETMRDFLTRRAGELREKIARLRPAEAELEECERLLKTDLSAEEASLHRREQQPGCWKR